MQGGGSAELERLRNVVVHLQVGSLCNCAAPFAFEDVFACLQKELELDFRKGMSLCHAEEVRPSQTSLRGCWPIAVAAPVHVRLQLAAARSHAAQATAAHRSCQTDFLRLERMFNEVMPVSSEWTKRIHKRTLMRLLGAQLPRSALTLQPQVMQENNELRARALLR
jgi:hypothetical protein